MGGSSPPPCLLSENRPGGVQGIFSPRSFVARGGGGQKLLKMIYDALKGKGDLGNAPAAREELLCCPAIPSCFPRVICRFDIPEIELLGLPPLRMGAEQLSTHLRLQSPKIRCPQKRVTSLYTRGLRLSINVSNTCRADFTAGQSRWAHGRCRWARPGASWGSVSLRRKQDQPSCRRRN